MAHPADVARGRNIVARWCNLAEQRLEYLTDLFETGRWRRFHSEREFLENIQEAKAAVATDDLASNPNALTSPMVGTAYLSPEPGKATFVTVGAKVSEGQTILIIEAMKTMNQIPAHKSGTVSRILVTDASPVEYGQPLAVID